MQKREIFEFYIISNLLNSHFKSENYYPNVDNMSYEELLDLEKRIEYINICLKDKQIKIIKKRYCEKKIMFCV